MATAVSATGLQVAGAFGFGMLIGWYVYYINRHRKNEVQLGDLVTLIGAIGGSAVLALFEAKTDLFGAYGLGLACGFFLYFFMLLGFVRRSSNFTTDWFLDGRRKKPAADEFIPDQAGPMVEGMGAPGGGGINR